MKALKYRMNYFYWIRPLKILEQFPHLLVDPVEVFCQLRAVTFVAGRGKGPLDLGLGKPHLSVLPIRKGYELALSETEEHLRANFSHFPFPFGNPGIG